MSISPVKLWRNQGKIQGLLKKEGTIVSWSLVRVPPAGFEDQAPYILVLVDIDGSHHMGQLVDTNNAAIKIGQKVATVLRRVRKPDQEGVIPYGIKFRLLGDRD